MTPPVGSAARRSRTASRRDIELFTELTGDHNPLRTTTNFLAPVRPGDEITAEVERWKRMPPNQLPGSVRRSPTMTASASASASWTVTHTSIACPSTVRPERRCDRTGGNSEIKECPNE
jgi:hypothetical protein